MLLKNVRIENAEKETDIKIENGLFLKIAPGQTPEFGEEVIEGKGKLVLPPFVESHAHLDSCLTAGQPRWNMSGTLFEGIDCWEERKPMLTREDIRERVHKVVQLQAAQGIQYVRAHVDINDPSLIAATKPAETEVTFPAF